MAATCISCRAPGVGLLVDFGPQAPNNRFMPPGEHDNDRHRLAVGQCAGCGLIQLVDPMPAALVRPRHAWLTYNEPESHLDELAGELARLPGLDRDAPVFGLTYKDDSTLARLRKLGFRHTFRLDMRTDLGIDDPLASIETLQERLTPEVARSISARHGAAALFVARHVLEHAHSPGTFLQALRCMLAPGGSVVLEMPDCSKFVDACDYPFVWEEHIAYFSPATLSDHLARCGYDRVETRLYPNALEDSLVAIARTGTAEGTGNITPGDLALEHARGKRFASGFDATRRAVREKLAALRGSGRRIAMFGAGHLAAKFVNLYEVADLLDCVIDDNPDKQGRTMPGSGLVIVGSAELDARGIDYCLLSLSPESEQKVLARRQDFVQRGGRFASIFRLSPIGILREVVA